ncbi:MAG: Ribose-phosphate pyrophosphokinase [Chlamydiia bacterium]|nr:Ribose-phosphate pyrophosphokinase [Chlamydiia bacterium]
MIDGVSPSGKAAVFGTAIRRFESFHPKINLASFAAMDNKKPCMLFCGRSHPKLAEEIAGNLKVELGKVHIEDFPDGEIGIQIKENVRGRDVFIVQSIARRPNFYLMELLILIDAFKRASAKNIVVVLPYYGYGRQDRKNKGREPITAKLVADLLERAGATRVITMDLHTEQIQGFFNIPVDNLYARPAFIEALKKEGVGNSVVVTPDIGGVKIGREFSSDLGTDLAIVNKRRLDAEQVEADALIGEVKGRDVLLVDDMYSTGGTIQKAASVCKALGAKRVIAAVTHGLMLTDEVKGIEKLYITNTLPLSNEKGFSNVSVVSVAELFAKAIEYVIQGLSISSMFKSS